MRNEDYILKSYQQALNHQDEVVEKPSIIDKLFPLYKFGIAEFFLSIVPDPFHAAYNNLNSQNM